MAAALCRSEPAQASQLSIAPGAANKAAVEAAGSTALIPFPATATLRHTAAWLAHRRGLSVRWESTCSLQARFRNERAVPPQHPGMKGLRAFPGVSLQRRGNSSRETSSGSVSRLPLDRQRTHRGAGGDAGTIIQLLATAIQPRNVSIVRWRPRCSGRYYYPMLSRPSSPPGDKGD